MKHYEAYDGTELIAEGTVSQIIEKLKINKRKFYHWKKKGDLGKDESFNIIEVDKTTEYAVYRGEEFQFIDKKENVIKRLGIKEKSFSFFLSPTNLKRDGDNKIIIVNLDKEVD